MVERKKTEQHNVTKLKQEAKLSLGYPTVLHHTHSTFEVT